MGRLNGGGPASVGSLGNSPAELSGRARRASEPPPVDPSVLFPGIMYYTRLNLSFELARNPEDSGEATAISGNSNTRKEIHVCSDESFGQQRYRGCVRKSRPLHFFAEYVLKYCFGGVY